MTTKSVIEMAREAGWKDLRDYDSEMRHDFFMGNTDSLARFAELVRADSRNATLDEIVLFIENYVEGYDRDYRELGLELAAEIQARKT